VRDSSSVGGVATVSVVANSPSARSSRPAAEMVERLGEHTALLRKYMALVQEGDPAYLGEIAAKIRLLAIETRSNKALMLRVGRLFGKTPTVTLEGPPGWEYQEGIKAGDTITLEDWLELFQLAVRTESSPDKPIEMTTREFVLVWAQQHGGSHEDWSLDERFQASRDTKVRVMGVRPNDLILMNIAGVILSRAEALLAWLTPERIADAAKRGPGGV
jgi:hypothetical protein